jgi:hypothetical protein
MAQIESLPVARPTDPDAETTTPTPSAAPVTVRSQADLWARREEKLLQHIHSNMQWMMETSGKSMRLSKRLGYVSLVLAVIAPLFAVSSAQNLVQTLHVQPGFLAVISAGLTVLLAITEGFRRIGRYEERWRTLDNAMLELRSSRETFRDARIEHALGTPERIAAYKALRGETDRILHLVTRSFHGDSRSSPPAATT